MSDHSTLEHWPIYAGVPIPALLLSRDLTIVAVNDAYLLQIGLQNQDITGRPFFELQSAESASGKLISESFHKLLEGESTDELRVPVYTPATSFAPAGWNIKNIAGHAKGATVSHIIHFAIPVNHLLQKPSAHEDSALKGPEFQVSAIKKYAIFSLDKEGIITSWNKGAENIKGYRAEDIIGKHVSTLYTPGDIALDLPTQNLAMALKNEGLETEGWRLAQNGRAFYANVNFMPLFNDAGEHYGFSKITRDITAERNDREKMSFLADITRNIEDPIVSTDNDLTITRWNNAAERLFEWTATEAIGRKTTDILQSQFSEEERNDILQALAETGYWQGEVTHLNKSGKELTSLCTVSHLKNVDGNISGNLILIKDITRQKEAANQLARLNSELEERVMQRTRELIQTEKKYEQLFNSNPMPLWVINQQDFSFMAVNQMAIFQYGYSQEEFLSMTAADIRPDEERELFLASDHSFVTSASNFNKGIWKHKKKDGSIIYAEIFAHEVMFENKPAKMVLSIDITGRMKAEEELAAREIFFRSIIENSGEGISLTDKNFVNIYRSPAAEKLAGNLESDNLFSRIHPEDAEMMEKIRLRLAETKGVPLPFTGRFKAADESYIWLEGTVNNLLDFKGVNAIVSNFRVVTDRIEAQQKLLAGEQQFRKTLNNMVAGVQVHDYNWRYIYVNDALAKFTNATKEQLMGATLMDIFPGVEETGAFKAMERVMHNRVTEQLETTFTFPDGRTGDFQLSIQPVPEGIFILLVDITERKQAQKESAKSQENYRSMMERISDAFVAIDTQWKYVYANKAAGIITNRGPEDLIGKNVWEEFPDAQGQQVYAAFHESLHTQQPVYLEEYYPATDVWLEYNIYPSPEGVTVFFSNINKRKRAEQQLVQSEGNLKAIFDNTSEGFILTDREGNIKLFNDRITETMLQDVSLEIKNGLNIFQVTETQRLDFFRHLMNQVLTGEKVHYDRQFDAPGGQKRWINLSFTPVLNGDKIEGVCIAARDVTERRRGEELLQKSYYEKRALAEKLSAILNTLPANIALVDMTGRIIEVNDAWRNFAKSNLYQGGQYGLGVNYLEVAAAATGAEETDGREVAIGLSRVLQDEDSEFVYEYPCDSPETGRWYRMIATSLQNKQYAGAVIMHLDITELRRLEAERMQLKQIEHKKITKAILKGQEKERNYIGRELHDNVNQILAGTRMYLSIAANKDEQIKELIRYPLELLDQSVEEIRKLCASMVTPANDIHLEELITGLLEKLQSGNIHTDFEYQVPHDAVSDELKLNLYRVLQEISSNIIKYAGASKVQLYLGMEEEALVLTVADNGIGFDLRAKKNGIGLSNMRSRVASFDGNLSIESSIGNGTKTTVRIPCYV